MSEQRTRLFFYIAIPAAVWFTYVVIHLTSSCDTECLRNKGRSGPKAKTILMWSERSTPFNIIPLGYDAFINKRCRYVNCFITTDEKFLADVTKFDALLFNGKHLTVPTSVPPKRSPDQKYVFVASESADYYHVCDEMYDDFFNWTWSYRLDSDIMWSYITIYDTQGNVVGPKIDMVWPQLDPVSTDLKLKLSQKSKVAAWFVSRCQTLSGREHYYNKLLVELKKLNYSWDIDVYGSCGKLSCSLSKKEMCLNMVEKYYHFYFSFENSFSEDYVTEKLLTALNYYAIPVVYGGANYSRFLPPGSYLDARELGPRKLLETINEILNDKERYYDFFRWRNHFQYKYTMESEDLCRLCEALNDKQKVSNRSSYSNFRRWWNDAKWNGSKKTCKLNWNTA